MEDHAVGRVLRDARSTDLVRRRVDEKVERTRGRHNVNPGARQRHEPVREPREPGLKTERKIEDQ